MSIHGVGKWQTVVMWYEIDPDDEEGLIERVMLFLTEEDRNAYLEERIATGLVYDLIGVIDSSWVEVDNPLPDVEENSTNGFHLNNSEGEHEMGELQKISDERVYCVFVWRQDNKYVREEAVKEYKTRKGAEDRAVELNKKEYVYVVREIYT